LGECFTDGIGVTKDLVEGYFWLSLAAENLREGSNRASAMSKLQEIEKLMLPEQIESAKAKVKTYTPYVQTPYKIGDPLKQNE
jgi:TPR repeat protein